jgi:hypothetical protein
LVNAYHEDAVLSVGSEFHYFSWVSSYFKISQF